LALETLGMSVAEGKTMLHGVQAFVATQQTLADLNRRRVCPACGQRYHSKDAGTHTIKTVFGPVEAPNPRWERCACQTEGPRTFRPAAAWLQGARSSPELLYLETKWASLIPFEKVANLMKEVLPVGEATNHETVREHLQAVAERIEKELGEERKPRDFAALEAIAELPLPDGPMTVGIDGGYVRAAHKQGCFEVIAGRSVVAFRRAEGDAVPLPKCFGYVQTYDQKPRQRLWEVMKSQGMQENQQVVFMSDGGEDVRQVQEGVPAPQRRTHHRLVSHHDAGDGAPTADQGAAGGAARGGRVVVQANREHQAPTVARQRRRSAGSHREPIHGFGLDQQTLGAGGQASDGDRGVLNLHTE